MKSFIIFVLSLVTTAGADGFNTTVLYKTAYDELNRSINKLRIKNQAPPYYISYRIEEVDKIEIGAEFGGLLYNNKEKRRTAYVDLRVGDYNFDNSNFMCQTRSSRIIGSEDTDLPIEDDYDAIRNALWLVTDGTYKKALEELSRKKATLQNRPRQEQIPDFSKAPSCPVDEPKIELSLDKELWADRIVELSDIFKDFPEIKESKIKFSITTTTRLFLDSEGNQNQSAAVLTGIEISAKAQSDDGDPLDYWRGFYAPRPEELPPFDSLKKTIRAVAETLSMQTKLKKEEDYSGPVLFLGKAATQLFFNLLGKGVSSPKSPVYENEMLSQRSSGKDLGRLSKRLGHRVMSKFLSAYDDPTTTAWKNNPLIGHFSVDDEGVCARHVDLVKDGKLISLLMSRSPIKKIRKSNGHGRFRSESYGSRVCGMVGNLFITSKQSSSTEQLIDTLLAICRDYEIPYGIIITYLEPTKPQTLKDRYMRYFRSLTGVTEKPLLPAPITAYRVDTATGKISLIRGLDFSSITPRVLRDIIGASDEVYVDNFIYYDDEGNSYPMSVVAPAVLIEEMDLTTKETKPEKPPLLPHPYFKK